MTTSNFLHVGTVERNLLQLSDTDDSASDVEHDPADGAHNIIFKHSISAESKAVSDMLEACLSSCSSSLKNSAGTVSERESMESVGKQFKQIQNELDRLIKQKENEMLLLRANVQDLTDRLVAKNDQEIKDLLYRTANSQNGATELLLPEANVENEIRRITTQMLEEVSTISEATREEGTVFACSVINSFMLIMLTIIVMTTAWMQDGVFITERLKEVTEQFQFDIVQWNHGPDALQSRMMRLQNEIQSKQLVIESLRGELQRQESENAAIIADAIWTNRFMNISIGFSFAVMTFAALSFVVRRREERLSNHQRPSGIRIITVPPRARSMLFQ